MKIWSLFERIKSSDLNANFAGLQDGSEINDGAITVPKLSNPYKFHAYRSANYTETNGSTVEFNAEEFDTNNDFNTSTFTYTVPVTGYYFLASGVTSNVSNGVGYHIHIRNGGVSVIRGSSHISAFTNSGGWSTSTATGIVQLDAGDTITVLWTGSTNTIFGGSAITYFSGYLVST